MVQISIKEKVRKKQWTLRDALSPQLRATWDDEIFARLTSLEFVRSARMIMCYVSCRSEVETHRFIKWRLQNGGRIAVPKVDLIYKALIASELDDFENDLHRGHFKILEPLHERIRLTLPEEITLNVLPGVAFDKKGNRLGYGKGYYDAFLHKSVPETVKLGLAYEPQVLENVPQSPWDVPVDVILTNQQLIPCSEKGRSIIEKEEIPPGKNPR